MLNIDKFLELSLQEDVGRGDLFSRVSKSINAQGRIIAKSRGILAGEIYGSRLAELQNFKIEWLKRDGETFEIGENLLKIEGDSHTILKIERTLLNIILHASSIATNSNSYVEIIKNSGFNTKILDTRKTRPMLRNFEKYASRIGGAINHRMGLDDALMLKDTHLKVITDLDNFLKNARKNIPFTSMIEIECETVEFAKEVIKKDIDILMCDNMNIDEVREVVNFRNEFSPKIKIEASGNMRLDRILEYAKTGVDAISIGAIIHGANWLDLSMKIE
jgi:nicotinate-nucleotide pyrophosphorylase (carboxylating)